MQMLWTRSFDHEMRQTCNLSYRATVGAARQPRHRPHITTQPFLHFGLETEHLQRTQKHMMWVQHMQQALLKEHRSVTAQ